MFLEFSGCPPKLTVTPQLYYETFRAFLFSTIVERLEFLDQDSHPIISKPLSYFRESCSLYDKNIADCVVGRFSDLHLQVASYFYKFIKLGTVLRTRSNHFAFTI